MRKRRYFTFGYFWFFYYDQYPNLKFNQISVNIPLKYSKKAVVRNSLKRKIVSFLQNEWYIKKSIGGKFYKIFVNLNKKNIWELKSQTEKFDKREVNHYILKEFQKSFFSFSKKIWR